MRHFGVVRSMGYSHSPEADQASLLGIRLAQPEVDAVYPGIETSYIDLHQNPRAGVPGGADCG
jgi:hypothetical protein